jgi:class 3 adenylate cyclase
LDLDRIQMWDDNAGMTLHVIGVAEPEEQTRSLLEIFLGQRGFHVLTPLDGAALSRAPAGEGIDAFLIDLDGGEGEGEGIALCQCIRSLDAHRRTPILCITDFKDPELISHAFAVGADDFIPKPIHLEALHTRLRLQIERKGYFEKLERARHMLRRYLSPRVASLAEEYSESGTLPPPMERRVAICMTDIRGFTALSETMDPVQLFTLLSAHLRQQIELVYKHGGYVDKFNGDGLMAIFDGEEMVEKSCICALEIMELTGRADGSKDKFPIGIGIHTGSVVLGNIGSPDHLDYSAVGTSVNLAARLFGYAQPETIIVSDAVKAAIGEHPDVQFVARRDVQVRGVSEPVTIHRLVRKITRHAAG